MDVHRFLPQEEASETQSGKRSNDEQWLIILTVTEHEWPLLVCDNRNSNSFQIFHDTICYWVVSPIIFFLAR